MSDRSCAEQRYVIDEAEFTRARRDATEHPMRSYRAQTAVLAGACSQQRLAKSACTMISRIVETRDTDKFICL